MSRLFQDLKGYIFAPQKVSDHISGAKYRELVSFEDREKKVKQIMKKFPDRIPVYLTLENNEDITLEKPFFLCPKENALSDLIFYLLRKTGKPDPSIAIYLKSSGNILSPGSTMKDIYRKHKNQDGLLYIEVQSELTFGNSNGL